MTMLLGPCLKATEVVVDMDHNSHRSMEWDGHNQHSIDLECHQEGGCPLSAGHWRYSVRRVQSQQQMQKKETYNARCPVFKSWDSKLNVLTMSINAGDVASQLFLA